MGRFLYAASAALLLLGSFPPTLAQTADPETTVIRKGLTQAEARKKIEKSGYSGVTAMKRDTGGNWTAMAMKGGKKTMVALSRTGTVLPVKVK
jgi:hypothetical protein